MSLLFALWCGFLWRVRGGAWEMLLGLPAGATKARAATGALIVLPLALSLPSGLGALAALGMSFAVGMALAGWGEAMDIGRVSGNRWGDAAAMSGWGVVVALPAAVVLGFLGCIAWPLLLGGMLFGPIYALAWHLPRLPVIPRFAAGPTEWAEVACGAALGLALWCSVR